MHRRDTRGIFCSFRATLKWVENDSNEEERKKKPNFCRQQATQSGPGTSVGYKQGIKGVFNTQRSHKFNEISWYVADKQLWGISRRTAGSWHHRGKAKNYKEEIHKGLIPLELNRIFVDYIWNYNVIIFTYTYLLIKVKIAFSFLKSFLLFLFPLLKEVLSHSSKEAFV